MGELGLFHRAKSGNIEGGVCLWAVLTVAGSSGLSKAKPMGVGKKGATGKDFQPLIPWSAKEEGTVLTLHPGFCRAK